MTKVIWSAKLYENDQQIVDRETSLGFDIRGLTGSLAAESLAENHFDIDQWDEWFGMDHCEGDIIITIHEPAQISGKYRVKLELEVKADASPYVEKEQV